MAGEIVKKDNKPDRGRGGKYNFPTTIPPEEPGAVRAALSSVLHWYKRGMESRVSSDDDIEARTLEYLQYCVDHDERPTVESYCLALGYPRQTVFRWEQAGGRRGDIIKNAKEAIFAYDGQMVSNGKLNPVVYIFRAKNYSGMKDQTDVVIEPRQSITDETAAEIGTKYSELPAE